MEKSEVKVMRKGAWTKEEDILLTKCIQHFGEGKWHLVPPRAGLNRCRKSCRMRWLNYLKPNVKRGYFDTAEVDLIHRLHKLLGNRWSLIAGRIPGRTANDVKNFWNTHICKKQQQQQQASKTKTKTKTNNIKIIKPRPRNLTKPQPQPPPESTIHANINVESSKINPTSSSSLSLSLSSPLLQMQMQEEGEGEGEGAGRWWEHLLDQLSSENGQGDVGPLSSLQNDNLLHTDININMDGDLMSDLLLDFHVWENTSTI